MPLVTAASEERVRGLFLGHVLSGWFNQTNETNQLDQSKQLAPHKHDRSKQNGQRKNEREASDPGRPENQGVIGPGSALHGELYDPPDARPDDEIVGQGQEK